MTTRTGELMIERLFEEARKSNPKLFSDVKRVHPHLFRHTMGTLMAENKIASGKIQRILGHSNVGTTERYYIRRSQVQLAETIAEYERIIDG